MPPALAVELVFDRTDDGCAGLDRACERGVDVRHFEVQQHGRAADRTRTEDAGLGELVGEVQGGAADLEVGVPDAAVRADEPVALDCAECLHVEVDGGRGVVHVRGTA